CCSSSYYYSTRLEGVLVIFVIFEDLFNQVLDVVSWDHSSHFVYFLAHPCSRLDRPDSNVQYRWFTNNLFGVSVGGVSDVLDECLHLPVGDTNERDTLFFSSCVASWHRVV